MVDEKETLSKLKSIDHMVYIYQLTILVTGYSSISVLPLYPIDTLKFQEIC